MSLLPLPDPARTLIRRLDAAGYPTYVVGGYLRDYLLGIKTHDLDLATAALPEEIEAVLDDCRIIPTGREHGTLTVVTGGLAAEVTTFREDGRYSDRRRPDRVRFTSSIREDLSRRDFTINAMAWREEEGWVDPWGGRCDLKARLIRAVGDPQTRFQEDALRILRALRLSSELGFRLEEETEGALIHEAPLLTHIAPERVRQELERLLCGREVQRVLTAYPSVLEILLPELSPLQADDGVLYRQAAERTARVSPDPPLRFAALLYRAEPLKAAGTAARRLRFSRDDINRIDRLVQSRVLTLTAEAGSIWPAWYALGDQLFRELLELQSAQEGENMDKIRAETESLTARGRLIRLSDLALNGNDLLERHYGGKQIGILLHELLRRVCVEGLPNDRDRLLRELVLIGGGRQESDHLRR